MGKIIAFDANAKLKKKSTILDKKTENISYDPTAFRLDKTEKDSYEKACKLAGNDPVARNIILGVLDFASPLGDAIMEFVNDVGVYDKRIPLLFYACDCEYYKFIHTICSFRNIPREKIVKITKRQEFINLIEMCKLQEAKYDYEYYDDGG